MPQANLSLESPPEYAVENVQNKFTHLLDKEMEEFRVVTSVAEKEADTLNVIEVRFDRLKKVTQQIDAIFHDDIKTLRNIQEGFRRNLADIFFQSEILKRAITWPEGYPGDYLTLEAVYANIPQSHSVLGATIDRYFLSRTLAVAVRSRLRTLCRLLNARTMDELPTPNWLDLACGPCRALLSVEPKGNMTVWAVDSDLNSLNYAESLLRSRSIHRHMKFQKVNAMKMMDADRNVEQFGRLTTIYSTGLFDYIPTEALVKLISGLYNSLAPNGVLISSFKDKERYDTFEYHWYTKWHYFFQRSTDEFVQIMQKAGIPSQNLAVERDDTGVIIFFTARR